MSVESDAKVLAEAILEEWEQYDDGDNNPKGHYCLFCYKESWKSVADIKHAIDCPVLVAKDVLTK